MATTIDLTTDATFRADLASGMSVRNLATKHGVGYGTAQAARAVILAEQDNTPAAIISMETAQAMVESVAASGDAPDSSEATAEDLETIAQAYETAAIAQLPNGADTVIEISEIQTIPTGGGLGLQTQTVQQQELTAVTSTVTPLVPATVNLDQQICVNLILKKPGDSARADTAEITVDADKGRLKLMKRVFTSDTYKQIQSLDVTIRQYLRENAVSAGDYLKSGMFMLAPAQVTQVDATIQTYFAQREVLVHQFMEEYPSLKEQSRSDLRVLFSETDYPSDKEMRAKFLADINYFAFHRAEALQGINSSIWEREERKAQERNERLASQIEEGLIAGAQDVLSKLIDRLTPDGSGKQKVVKDSTVDNWREFFEALKSRNMTGNTTLQSVADAAINALNGVTGAGIRKGEFSRDTLREQFEAILPLVDTSVAPKPKRAVSFED